jgi:hypothetical protein
LLIHASKSSNDFTENIELVKREYGISVPLEVDRGGIVGVVDVIDCLEIHKSKWFNGRFGWVLANPRRLSFVRATVLCACSGQNTKDFVCSGSW